MLHMGSSEEEMQPHRGSSAVWDLPRLQHNLRPTSRKWLQGSPDFSRNMKTVKGPPSSARKRRPPLICAVRGSPRTESHEIRAGVAEIGEGDPGLEARMVCPTCSLRHDACHVCGPAMACAFRHTTIPPRHRCHHCASAWYTPTRPTEMTHITQQDISTTTHPNRQDSTTRLMIADSLLHFSQDGPTICTKMGSGQVEWTEPEQEPCRAGARTTNTQDPHAASLRVQLSTRDHSSEACYRMGKDKDPCTTSSGTPATHENPPLELPVTPQEKRQGAEMAESASGPDSPTPMDLDPVRSGPPSRHTPTPVWQPLEASQCQPPLTAGTASHQPYGLSASPDYKDYRTR